MNTAVEHPEELLDVPEELRAANIDITPEEFETYLNSLDSLCLLEASQLKRQIDDNLRQWQICKNAMTDINSKKLGDELNAAVIKSNILQTVNVDVADTFDAEYERNVGYLNRIADKLLGIIDANKDKVNSTVFMSNEMLTIMKKRIAHLKPTSANYQRELRIAETITHTFEDRLVGGFENRAFLSDKFQYYLVTHRKEIRKSFRDEAGIIAANGKTKAIKDLCTKFSENAVAKFMESLLTAFDKAMDMRVDCILIFTNFLAHCIKSGKKNGSDSYAKLLVLDLVDIFNGIYDVPGVSEEEYLYDVGKMFGRHAMAYSDDNNIHVKVGRRFITESTFGLNLPKITTPWPSESQNADSNDDKTVSDMDTTINESSDSTTSSAGSVAN